MKELSIEEKAKRYDKAFIKSREFLAICEKCGAKDTVEFIEDIFPELKMDKESEDERIRKVLIGWINLEPSISFGDTFNGFSKEQILAWLEKQGKPVEINPSEFESQLNKLLKQFESLPKEELISSLIFYLNVVQNNGTYKSDEKQGQKVDNNVEPKFKVGDWCIDNEDGTIFQIVKVLDNTYRYRTNEGKEYSCARYSLELDARFWTIDDAKEGDILHSTGFHNDCIFIFNGLDNWKFDEPNGDRAVATGYCCLSVSADNMEFGMQGPDCVEVNTVKPATKIQRDLLSRKIKEAGYEWDAEKKELKEIENEEYDGEDYGIDGLWHAKNILEKTLGKVDGYQTDDGILDHKCAISFIDKLYKQKPAEWSEEDESNFQGIIDELKANKHHAPDSDLPTYDRFLSWFKSLKNRYGWKPSDEQMKALDWALSLAKNCGDECAFDLRTLQEQLKKL